MATSLKITPFINWDEWISVKSDLYSSNVTSRCLGVERVAAWRKRGGIPHSVDMTAQLVDIILKDPHFGFNLLGLYSHETENIQLLYAITIVRAVNGLVDPNQQGYYAQSVLSLAEKLRLPGWIVELRHDATHNRLPSMSVLRAASSFMMSWFQTNYWEPQYTYLQSLTQFSVPPTNLFPIPKGIRQLTQTWKQEFVKNCTSSVTFLIDIFIPTFLTAITTFPPHLLSTLPTLLTPTNDPISESSSEHHWKAELIQLATQQVASQQAVWMISFDTIIHTIEKWIHPLLCKLLKTFLDVLDHPIESIACWTPRLFTLLVLCGWTKELVTIRYAQELQSPTLSRQDMLYLKRIQKQQTKRSGGGDPSIGGEEEKENQDEEEEEEEEAVDTGTFGGTSNGNLSGKEKERNPVRRWKRQYVRALLLALQRYPHHQSSPPLVEEVATSEHVQAVEQGIVADMLSIFTNYATVSIPVEATHSSTQTKSIDDQVTANMSLTTKSPSDNTATTTTSSSPKEDNQTESQMEQNDLENWLQKFQRNKQSTTNKGGKKKRAAMDKERKALLSDEEPPGVKKLKTIEPEVHLAQELPVKRGTEHKVSYHEVVSGKWLQESREKNVPLTIVQCEDYPAWPVGLLPGHYDNHELQNISVVEIQDVVSLL